MWQAVPRLLAYWLDMLVLFAILGGTQALLSRLVGFPSWAGFNQNPFLLEGWVLLTISLPAWVYFILSDRSVPGATLGKRVFGLHTVTTAGGRVSTGQAVLRTALKLFPWELSHVSVMLPNPLLVAEAAPVQMAGLALANALLILYGVVLLVHAGRRSIHDLAAGTAVEPATAQGRPG